jgi:hypothetical protein
MDRAHNVQNHDFVEIIHFETTEEPETCHGDMDEDSVIGVSDLLVVISAFGCEGECGKPDMDGDGYVIVHDVISFLAIFGDSCE